MLHSTIIRGRRRQRTRDTDSRVDALQAATRVAQILVVSIPLQVSKPRVCVHQIQLRLAVAMDVFGCAVQVFENARDQELLRSRRTRQFLNGFV